MRDGSNWPPRDKKKKPMISILWDHAEMDEWQQIWDSSNQNRLMRVYFQPHLCSFRRPWWRHNLPRNLLLNYISNFLFSYFFADSFVNSQEWTLSRQVPDIRLGIVGSLSSGKSALVHRYLTGSYMQEESPEGGRFKKEVVVDGQSFLLLIRDEGGPPEIQVSCVLLALRS